MATATISRPPLPPFSRESAIQKVRLAEDGWNTRDPEKVALATRLIQDGGTARSSSRDEPKSSRSSLASGRRSWTIGSLKKYGRLPGTTSRCASLTIQVIGIAPMAIRTGSSMMMGSWLYGSHRSTTFQFRNQIANIIGRWDAVRTTIPD
jgi:hypothetical protein